MVQLHCRECGTEISSDTRKTKCPQCGVMFPFACAVCQKLLNPPIPDYPIERYFTADGKPLCEDHYQRQCPECERWFQADDNPGFFLCRDCTAKRPPVTASTGVAGVSGDTDDYVLARSEGSSAPVAKPANRAVRRSVDTEAVDESGAAPSAKSGCGAGMLCLLLLPAIGLSWHFWGLAGLWQR